MSFVPMIISKQSEGLAPKYFPDAPAFLVRADKVQGLVAASLAKKRLWLDFEFDGFFNRSADRDTKWTNRMKSLLGNPLFDGMSGGTLTASQAKEVADRVCKEAVAQKASWLSIPQLPTDGTAKRAKFNSVLADGFGRERPRSGFAGTRVLPVILTASSLVDSPKKRKELCNQIVARREASAANCVWVLESSLEELTGAETLDSKRFPALIDLHDNLRKSLPKGTQIAAGPYWCFGLLLWARGLADFPMWSVGQLRRYRFPGASFKGNNAPKARMAIDSLVRVIEVSSATREWLEDCVATLKPNDPARPQIEEDLAFARSRPDVNTGIEQMTKCYAKRVKHLEGTVGPGRALMLYQIASSAYVLGAQLPAIKGESGPAKRPERIAKQYMLLCL